jgi:hypothetical protein
VLRITDSSSLSSGPTVFCIESRRSRAEARSAAVTGPSLRCRRTARSAAVEFHSDVSFWSRSASGRLDARSSSMRVTSSSAVRSSSGPCCAMKPPTAISAGTSDSSREYAAFSHFACPSLVAVNSAKRSTSVAASSGATPPQAMRPWMMRRRWSEPFSRESARRSAGTARGS